MKRLAGARSICLDAYGTDTAKKKYDMEIQREDKGADPHRARYHSSVLDVENLDAGQEFKQLPDTYTIFITEKDVYGQGEPLYPIERMNLATGKPFGDGEHILYVNGAYRGDSDLGRLMHDFSCTDAKDMNFDLMAERTRYLKENPKGVGQVCKIMEEMREASWQGGRIEGKIEGKIEGANEEKKNTVLRMLASGSLPLERIAEFSGLSLDEVKKLSEDRTA